MLVEFFICRLQINAQSHAHKLFGGILKKKLLTFLPISAKIVAPPKNLVQMMQQFERIFLPLKSRQTP